MAAEPMRIILWNEVYACSVCNTMKRMAEMLSSFFFYCTFNITALFHTFAESKNIYSMETPRLNAHNKEEHRPSHTCEFNLRPIILF